MDKTLYNQVGEIKGKISEKEDSFSFQFTPQNENLRATRGALFSLVTVQTEDPKRSEKAASFYQAFQSSYYAKSNGSIIKGLSDTLDSVDKEFNQKAEAEKYSLIAAVLWGSVLYLAKLGDCSVFIARAGKVKKLDFNKVASGVLENQDTVCLASQAFAETVDNEKLGELLNQEKFEKTLEAVDKAIAEKEGASSVVIRLSIDAPEEKPIPVVVAEVNPEGGVEPAAAEQTFEREETGVMAESEIKPLVPAPLNQETKQKTNFLETAQTKAKASFAKVAPLVQEKGLSLWKFISNPWRKRQPGELVDHVAIRRARILQIVLLFVLVLMASLFFTFFGKSKNAKSEKIDTYLNSAQEKISQARNFKTIDPIRAKNFLEKAGQDTAEAKKIDSKNPKVSAQEKEEDSLLAEITRVYKVSSLQTLSDLAKLQKNAAISRMALLDNTIELTDKENSTLYSFSITSNEAKKIDTTLKQPINITSFSSGYYIQDNQGIYKLDKNGKLTNVGSNSNWGEIVGSATYQNNLYLLDSAKGDIWKYTASGASLSSGKPYLSGEKPNLANASGLTIDGFVWVVDKKGNVFKFSVGKKQEFGLSGYTDTFGEVVDIYTSAEAKNLYLLDKGKGRVVVFTKDGIYIESYSQASFTKATSLIVLETQKKIYLSYQGKLSAFDLR